MVTLAVANQKGGTGKTTTAVTLAHKLAIDGHRTMLIDTDPQGHVSAALGLKKAPGIKALVGWDTGMQDDILMVQAREGLDVIPSDLTTKDAKSMLVSSVEYREFFLTRIIDEFCRDYDVVIIDCAPSVDVLHRAALIAADWLVVPTRLDYLAVDGVREVITFLREESDKMPRGSLQMAKLFCVLPTFYDRRTKETREQLRALAVTFKERGLLNAPIPIDVKLREAPAFGETIWEYAPGSRSIVGIEGANGNLYGGYDSFVEGVKRIL
ncbi:MAG: ParA family protein [Chloroflexota bacterium]|nr:ParA family protein [Chloroflexota bacterium]